jgi:hypothetical protein
MGKDLDESRNFGPEWDLSRFVHALESLKDKKKVAPKLFDYFPQILAELGKWRSVRNGFSHPSYSGREKEDKEGEGDEDLEKRIMEAKVLIPRINGMRMGSREMKRLEGRLNTLATRLGLQEESSEVPSLSRTPLIPRTNSSKSSSQPNSPQTIIHIQTAELGHLYFNLQS